MKFEHQTTAVDMWAAGVILLSILSRTYPFFRAPDDLTALAELLSMFGKKAVQEAAGQYGKRLICSELVEPVDLQVLCQRLAERRQPEEMSKETSSSLNLASDQAVDLLSKILTLSSHERLTAEDALRHPFFED
jgi:cell division control protein 7